MASPLPGIDPAGAVDTVAHIVQVALTPVFLLSGIGTLLNVFNTRLSRVSDHINRLSETLRGAEPGSDQKRSRAHFKHLLRRRLLLDASVVTAAIGGAATCGAAFVLFLGGVRDAEIASWLVALFGVALGCTVCSLIAFLLDSVLAWHGLHRHE